MKRLLILTVYVLSIYVINAQERYMSNQQRYTTSIGGIAGGGINHVRPSGPLYSPEEVKYMLRNQPKTVIVAPIIPKASKEEVASSVKSNRLKCAEAGMATFQYDLGMDYLSKTNKAEAMKWLMKAAEQGHKQSQEQILKMVK